MISFSTKQHLLNALKPFDGATIVDSRKELYRILKIAEELGWTWGSRTMYGGGNLIVVYDDLDQAAEIVLCNERIKLILHEDYFKEDFEPSVPAPYNPELEAELRNEEALYGYELPRPW